MIIPGREGIGRFLIMIKPAQNRERKRGRQREPKTEKQTQTLDARNKTKGYDVCANRNSTEHFWFLYDSHSGPFLSFSVFRIDLIRSTCPFSSFLFKIPPTLPSVVRISCV